MAKVCMLTIKILSIGTCEIMDFVPNGKLMVLGVPIFNTYAVICPNFGTPQKELIIHLEQWKICYFEVSQYMYLSTLFDVAVLIMTYCICHFSWHSRFQSVSGLHYSLPLRYESALNVVRFVRFQ